MECTRKFTDTVNQSYEIHVCFNDLGAVITTYERLRFALLASIWVPKPLGILLWSVLHVLLVVGGASLLVLAAATFLSLSLALDSIWFPHCIFIVCCLLLWGIPCLIWSLMRLSWSLICESRRLHQIRVACRSFVEWWDPSKLPFMSFRRGWMEMVGWIGLRLTRTCVNIMVQERHSWCRLLGWWCEEVVHMHDAIGI